MGSSIKGNSEDKRKEWHETGSNDILEEVGKRVTKELLENTKDSTGMIENMENRIYRKTHEFIWRIKHANPKQCNQHN